MCYTALLTIVNNNDEFTSLKLFNSYMIKLHVHCMKFLQKEKGKNNKQFKLRNLQKLCDFYNAMSIHPTLKSAF